VRPREPCRLFSRQIHKGRDDVFRLYNLPSFQGPAVNSASAVTAGASFGNVRGILNPPSLDSRTSTAIIREAERYFLIGISHCRALLLVNFPRAQSSPHSGVSAPLYFSLGNVPYIRRVVFGIKMFYPHA
jgi:hypothetical protein